MAARNRANIKTRGVAPPKAPTPKKAKPEPHVYVNYGLHPVAIGGLWFLFVAFLFVLTEGCRR